MKGYCLPFHYRKFLPDTLSCWGKYTSCGAKQSLDPVLLARPIFLQLLPRCNHIIPLMLQYKM